MDIQSLEINLLKISEIKDGDIILVKIDDKDKSSFTKEKIQSLYNQILSLINKKDISIYFFPKSIDVNLIKMHIENVNKKIENLKNEN